MAKRLGLLIVDAVERITGPNSGDTVVGCDSARNVCAPFLSNCIVVEV
jgi:hypothetical protein